MRAKTNNRKIVTIAQMFIFKWCFISRSRRGCLSSVLGSFSMNDGNGNDSAINWEFDWSEEK